MQLTITINGESVTLQGVTDGANIDLTSQSAPTPPPPVAAPREFTRRMWVPSDEVRPGDVIIDTVDATEPTAPTTVAPKGVNRSDRKRPQSKTGPIKGKGADPVKRKGGQSPLQAAGMAKTRHGRYGSVKTAQSWLNAEMHAGDAERIKICQKVLRRNFRLSKTGSVTAKA
jgi:hypothetical protein